MCVHVCTYARVCVCVHVYACCVHVHACKCVYACEEPVRRACGCCLWGGCRSLGTQLGAREQRRTKRTDLLPGDLLSLAKAYYTGGGRQRSDKEGLTLSPELFKGPPQKSLLLYWLLCGCKLGSGMLPEPEHHHLPLPGQARGALLCKSRSPGNQRRVSLGTLCSS